MLLIGDQVKIIKGIHKGEIGTIRAYDGFAFYTIMLKKAEKTIKCTKGDFEPVPKD